MAKNMKDLIDAQTNGASKPRTAEEVATDTSIDSIGDIIKRVGASMDTDKATVSVALLNTFGLAVNKIGGRGAWNVRDFMAYGLALAALEQVTAADETDYSGGRADRAGLNGVAEALN